VRPGDPVLPALARSQPVKSIRYKGPIFKVAIAIFVVSFVVLGYLGTQPATALATCSRRSSPRCTSCSSC